MLIMIFNNPLEFVFGSAASSHYESFSRVEGAKEAGRLPTDCEQLEKHPPRVSAEKNSFYRLLDSPQRRKTSIPSIINTTTTTTSRSENDQSAQHSNTAAITP